MTPDRNKTLKPLFTPKIPSRSVIHSTLFSCKEFGESGVSGEFGKPCDSGESCESDESVNSGESGDSGDQQHQRIGSISESVTCIGKDICP